MPTTYETRAFACKDATVTSAVLPILSFGFTASQLSQAKRAFITVDAQSVRMTYDGTDPSASFGHLMVATVSSFTIEGTANIKNLKFYRGTGTDGEVTITLETDLG